MIPFDNAGLLGRSLLTTQEWSDADLATVRSIARALASLDQRGIRTHLCPDELAWAVFFDQSTRTKSAWAGAAARLGMHPVIVDGSSTQVSHGETAVETGAMLGMNAHAMGIRHDLILGEGNTFIRDVQQGIDDYLAATDDARSVPIVNLQCDVDHPTQTLADLLWLEDNFDDLAGRKITVSWAYSPSYAKPLSVPQGLITLLTRVGADVTLAHPPGYQLTDEAMTAAADNATAGGSFRMVGDMDEAFGGADDRVPEELGRPRPHDRAGGGQRCRRRRRTPRDRGASAGTQRRAHRLDLRRAPHGHNRGRRRPLHALSARRHRGRGQRRRDGTAPGERRPRGELEGLRGDGVARRGEGPRPQRRADHSGGGTPMNDLDIHIAERSQDHLALAVEILREAIRIPADYVDRPVEAGGDPAAG